MQSNGSVHVSHSYMGMTVFQETLAPYFKEGYEHGNPYEICKSKLGEQARQTGKTIKEPYWQVMTGPSKESSRTKKWWTNNLHNGQQDTFSRTEWYYQSLSNSCIYGHNNAASVPHSS